MVEHPLVPEELKFTGKDASEVLSELPADLAQAIGERLVAKAAESHIDALKKQTYYSAAYLAVVAHLNYHDDVPGEFDIHRDRMTRDMSERFLLDYGELEESARSSIPSSVVDFATCFYVARELKYGASYEELSEILEPVGMDLNAIHLRLSDLMFEAGYNQSFRTVEEFRLALGNNIRRIAWNNRDGITMPPLEQAMRRDMLAAGFTLPELTADNTYGYDEHEEEYIIPELSDDDLPQ